MRHLIGQEPWRTVTVTLTVFQIVDGVLAALDDGAEGIGLARIILALLVVAVGELGRQLTTPVADPAFIDSNGERVSLIPERG